MRGKSFVKRWWLLLSILIFCQMLMACSSKNVAQTAHHKSTFKGSIYVVKRGDTLSKISRMTGSSVAELARINGISAPYTILVGQRIHLNGMAVTTSAKNTIKRRKSPRRPSAKVTPPPIGARCWLWPTQGNIIVPFSGSEGGNKGIDIAGSRGQPIYASAAGTVVYVGNQLRGYGNLVMIKHSENFITAYAHNETTLVNNGQKVKAGQQIATMGSTGTSSVRLHFQLRYRAVAIDPKPYLKPSC